MNHLHLGQIASSQELREQPLQQVAAGHESRRLQGCNAEKSPGFFSKVLWQTLLIGSGSHRQTLELINYCPMLMIAIDSVRDILKD